MGYVVRGPIGGMAWHHMQYFLGLARLGHDVLFLEESGEYANCYDPERHVLDWDPTYGLRFAADAFSRFGLSDQWAYYDVPTAQWLGPAGPTAEAFTRSADVVLNLSGVNPLRDWSEKAPIRILVDTDPVFTQVRHLTIDSLRNQAVRHNAFFTFAENVERGTAQLPDDGFDWLPTRQPVVLDAWPVNRAPSGGSYTTVMQWQSYTPVEYSGRWYGTKSTSFKRFIDLPSRVPVALEMALGSEDAPREMLTEKGWSIRDPLDVARSPWDYQKYIQGSRAGFSVAKHGYVVSNSGWFSERSACYLASGRPVITQETGFSEYFPSDAGVFAYTNTAQLLAAIDELERNYEYHAERTRQSAEFFDSRSVLPRLLADAIRTVAP
ncbi:MAG TPA: hypothetical protein VHM24_13110 [Gemmatimonadaceae bacterium]|nr:hypothetical protein [Gemmatimonadaceae bacterium]